MLLPSALSCDQGLSHTKSQRPSRPKLPSFERYDPCRRSQSPVLGLIASCRALQNMLGERFSTSPSPSPSIDTSHYANPLCSPFGQPTPPPVQQPAPRGHNKRTRICLDEDEQDQSVYHSRETFATPKRRRTMPVELPPGLMAADFEALADTGLAQPEVVRSKEDPQEIEMPFEEEESCETSGLIPWSNNWTENDDRLLVETVLSKLNLSTREWNDCAMRLGKDKDSLGRRWQLLLGEGNVGLRRGAGRMSRVDLDIRSW